MAKKNRTPWYISGLHFECLRCGGCCSGPSTGYIWVTSLEIKFIAGFLKISPEQLRQRYLKRVGLRTTIIEQPVTKDCVFLQVLGTPYGESSRQKKCMIYPVRPSQCRIWPFWTENLVSPTTWSQAVQKCGGINHGRFYSFEEIEKIRKNKKWWSDSKHTVDSSKE